DPLLIGEIALLAIAEIADDGLEALRIERAVHALEVRVGHDDAQRLGIGLVQSELAGLLVQRGFGQRLLQHLAVETERARLLLRQRTAELPANLLQSIGVDLAEIVGRNLGAADLRERRLAKSPEDVGDAPDAKADDE